MRRNNFDFNKWVDGGVGFLSQYFIDKEIYGLNDKILLDNSHLSNDDIQLVLGVFKLVDEWLFNLIRTRRYYKENKSSSSIIFRDELHISHFLNSNSKRFKKNDRNGDQSSSYLNTEKILLDNALILPNEFTNSHHKQLIIQQEITKKYPFLTMYISQKESKQCVILMKSYNEDELKNNLSFKRVEELYYAIGVKHAIDMLIKYKKPIIGHNMMLDIMQIYSSFIGPLPLDCNIYKRKILELFPVILDTKKIASRHQILYKESEITSTELGRLFKILLNITNDKSIKISLEKSFSRYNLESFCKELRQNVNDMNHSNLNEYKSKGDDHTDNILDFSHEAGFDALLTGICFINLGILIGAQHPIFPSDSIYQFDINKVNFFKNTFDFNRESDGESRKMLFYFTGIKDYSNYDIRECFEKIGRSRFHRIDEDSGVLEFLEGHMTEFTIKEVINFKKWKIRSMVEIDKEEKENLIQTMNNNM